MVAAPPIAPAEIGRTVRDDEHMQQAGAVPLVHAGTFQNGDGHKAADGTARTSYEGVVKLRPLLGVKILLSGPGWCPFRCPFA